MLERDYSHPSVVMWSHGNESNPGTTTLQVHKFIKAEDPQRPDMFSWAQDVPVTQELPYDIYSFHYPDVMKGPGQLAECQTAVFNSESQIIKRVPKFIGPVIADEFAHVSVGNAAINDPNIRNFWGESIKLFWDYMYNTNGSLGGNQFGVYMGLENKVNAPEEWLMRKAYSPVHIENEFLDQTKDGNLSFRVQNRFSHTNLNEIKLQWKSGTKSGSIMCPSIAPAKYGVITLPVKEIKKGDLVEMVFLRKDGFQLDEFALYVIADPFVMPAFCGKAPALNENESSVIITGDKIKIEISKKTGQILSGDYNGKTIITGGPQLNINGTKDPLPEWSCTKVSSAIKNNLAVVVIEGKYASCKAVFTLQIDNNGIIDTQYAISDFKFELLALHEVPWNQQYYGGLKEVGVKYELSADIDRLSWDRKALWSVYPDNHIGAAKGTALKVVPENPNDWGTFTSDHGTYMTFGTKKESFNNNFRGMKEYIRTATLFASNKNCGLQVFSPMTDAVRLDQSQNGEGKIELRINNQWNYPELGLGNYMKRPIYVFENSLNGVVRMRFTD